MPIAKTERATAKRATAKSAKTPVRKHQDKKENAKRARADLNRRLILEGAERVFAERGFDAAKMEDIVREAGVSLGTAYTVFRGKAEIYRDVHEAGDTELLERGAEAARVLTDPVDIVLAGVRGTVEYFLDRPDFLRMHLREGAPWAFDTSGAGSKDRIGAWEQGMRMMTAAFARCVDEGRFAPGDPRTMARLAVAMQQVHLAVWVENGMQREPGEVVAEILDQVRRTFVVK